MSRRIPLVSAFVVSAMIAESILAGGWNTPVPQDKIPQLSIPKMSKPPVIDGKIDTEEWQESTAISGIGGCMDAALIARPTTYFLAWDDEHLYLAFKTWVKPGYKPSVGGREPGSASAFDDGGEFHFQPMGKNVAQGRTSSSYKFNINCLGVDGDFNRVAVGQQFKNWLPEFKRAFRQTEPGSAPNGGSWWECEVSMTTKDFELNGPNRPGDQWKMMLGFNHMYSGWTQARIAAISSYFDPCGYPVCTLVENTPAVQMSMDDLPGPMDGVAAARIKVFNPTAQPVQVSISALYADTEIKKVDNKDVTNTVELVKKEHILAVGPGKSAEWSISENLPKKIEKPTGTIEYHVQAGGKDIFRYFTFFCTQYPPDAMAPAQPRKEAFPLQATLNPARDNLSFVADSYYLDKPEDVKEVKYKVVKDGDSKPIAEGSIDKSNTFYYRRLIQFPPLKEGDYTVEASMEMKDGKSLGPVKAAFKKLDEAKVFAEWWDTKVADTERVIKPFIPIVLKDGAVSVWGRTYKLGPLGLPDEITSQGRPVSAGPARIVAVINGKEEVIPFKEPVTFTDTKEWRVSLSGKAKGAGLVFETTGCVEQDGLASVELTYAPEGGPVKLDSLRIEFPISGECGECLLCLGSDGNYASRSTILLPPEKQGVLWNTLDTGKNGSHMLVGSFYPCVWIGNDLRGLLWWGDSDKGWVPDDAVPAHEVIRGKISDFSVQVSGAGIQEPTPDTRHPTSDTSCIVLRNNIVAKQFTLEKPRTILFHYMASPFRPLVKGWRASIWSADGTFEGPNKEVKDAAGKKIVDGWCWLTPPSVKPEEWSAMWAKFKEIADKRIHELQPFDPSGSRNGYGSTVHTSLPLMGYGWKSPDEKVTGYFAADWEGDSWSKTEQDYFLWIADRAFREGGLREIYWDIFFPGRFSTLQNGLAYELPDGRIQPGFNGMNIRSFMMRMYAVMDRNGLTPGSQVSHATNDYCLVAAPWMDAILDGEYHSVSDDSGMDWVDGYPIERMRSMSTSANFGSVISWMNLMAFKDPEKARMANRGFIEYPRLYDTWCGGGGYTKIPQPVLDWGINDEHNIYHPFWRNPFVVCDDKDILVSMWQLPDRVTMMVFNYNRKEAKDAVLRVDLDKLGLVPQLQWQEFVGIRDLAKDEKEPDSKLDFHGRTVTVPALKPHTGRVIGVRRY